MFVIAVDKGSKQDALFVVNVKRSRKGFLNNKSHEILVRRAYDASVHKVSNRNKKPESKSLATEG